MKVSAQDRYKTIRKLGQGGQGSVLLVEDVTLRGRSPLALKKLRRNPRPEALDRFKREIDALQSVSHPAVVQVLDHSLDSDPPFYVMEYFEGARTLHEIIASGPNPFRGDALAGIGLFQKIVEGLQACHYNDSKIIHRDLKPGNVLILASGAVKIIDFGCCFMEGSEAITLVEDGGIGARNYSPPECQAGGSREIGPWTDLYSAGKVLWAAVAGMPFAFDRETPVFGPQSMSKVQRNRPQTWHLQVVFEHCIRERPRDRWRDTHNALCVFRTKPDTDSGGIRTPIPIQSGQ